MMGPPMMDRVGDSPMRASSVISALKVPIDGDYNVCEEVLLPGVLLLPPNIDFFFYAYVPLEHKQKTILFFWQNNT